MSWCDAYRKVALNLLRLDHDDSSLESTDEGDLEIDSFLHEVKNMKTVARRSPLAEEGNRKSLAASMTRKWLFISLSKTRGENVSIELESLLEIVDAT